MQKMMKIKLNRSSAGCVPKHRATVKGLGFRRVNEERTIVDTPQTRGMVKEVCYLVSITEEGTKAPKQAKI